MNNWKLLPISGLRGCSWGCFAVVEYLMLTPYPTQVTLIYKHRAGAKQFRNSAVCDLTQVSAGSPHKQESVAADVPGRTKQLDAVWPSCQVVQGFLLTLHQDGLPLIGIADQLLHCHTLQGSARAPSGGGASSALRKFSTVRAAVTYNAPSALVKECELFCCQWLVSSIFFTPVLMNLLHTAKH